MNERRALQFTRIALGLFLLWRAIAILSVNQESAELLAQTANWTGWPLIGSMRPLELTFTSSFTLFFIGAFLAGGLLTRILSFVTVVIAIASFVLFGLQFWPSHLIILVLGLVIVLKGGGAGTMDSALGAMQRRSIEREAERDAERAAQRALDAADASNTSA
jgi:hypothetical protein